MFSIVLDIVITQAAILKFSTGHFNYSFFLSSKLEDRFKMVCKPVYLPEIEDEKF